ncbi:MAG: hypothetical protein IKF72_04890 [Kiritimatiellae bacterium]|nr:hypothetical protein [Kiritimatiellia bacterium]
MTKMLKVAAAGCLAAACGCMTSPVAFKSSSAPIPPQGYTVAGSDVTGSSDQIWVFGLGGSLGVQQHKAYKAALASANGADALVGMSIEQHTLFAMFFAMKSVTVTGTPVKFNTPASK